MNVIIVCDGASRGNPGKGGWGAIVATPSKVHEYGGRSDFTTNNQMELTAAIEGLKATPSDATHIDVYTDSAYVVNGMTKWMAGWIAREWKTMAKKPVENAELWHELADASDMHTRRGAVVHWRLVPGHAGIPANERVDAIATAFADSIGSKLFNGARADYSVSLNLSTPKDFVKKDRKKGSSAPAYSYVSLLDGKVMTHKTWEECKARVLGKPARFKKVFSAAEEAALVKEWT